MKKLFTFLTCLLIPGVSFAAVDLTGLEVDVTTPESLAAIILTGLAVIWGIRKLIKIINRS